MQYRGDKIGRKFCGVTVVLDNLKIIGDLTHSVLARCVRIWWKKQDGGVGQGQDISWAWNKRDEQNLEECGWRLKNHENLPQNFSRKIIHFVLYVLGGSGSRLGGREIGGSARAVTLLLSTQFESS